MRLFRALRAIWHYKVSTLLQKASNWHLCRAEAIHADIRLRRLGAGAHTDQEANFPLASAHNASRVLLASLVGLAICCAWIWFTARAGR